MDPQRIDPTQALTISEMADLASNCFGWDRAETQRRLQLEESLSGFNVVEDFVSRGLTPFEWSERLEAFYETTQAFVFELLLYNSQSDRRRLRQSILDILRAERQKTGTRVSVLFWGDGLGFDSLAAALDEPQNQVTYFDVGGLSSRFAHYIFEAHDVRNLHIALTSADLLPHKYDAIISIDVLEHLPDPVSWIGDARRLLNDRAILVIKEAFDAIIPARPTHLRSNAAHAYRTPELFARMGFTCERYGNFPYVFRYGHTSNALWRAHLYHKLTAPVKRLLIQPRLHAKVNLTAFLEEAAPTARL